MPKKKQGPPPLRPKADALKGVVVKTTEEPIPEPTPSMLFFGESLDSAVSLKDAAKKTAHENPKRKGPPPLKSAQQGILADQVTQVSQDSAVTPVPMATPSMILSSTNLEDILSPSPLPPEEEPIDGPESPGPESPGPESPGPESPGPESPVPMATPSMILSSTNLEDILASTSSREETQQKATEQDSMGVGVKPSVDDLLTDYLQSADVDQASPPHKKPAVSPRTDSESTAEARGQGSDTWFHDRSQPNKRSLAYRIGARIARAIVRRRS